MADTKKRKVVPIRNDKTSESGTSPRKPLVESAFEKIHEAIYDGTFLPGQRILEAEIASWLDISRTPVREALRRLVEKDALSYDRYGNLIVTRADRQMIIEIFQMREVLETAAARLAARYAYDEEIETLKELADAHRSHPPSRKEHQQFNTVFHRTITQAAHNRYITRAFEALPHPVRWYSMKDQTTPERYQQIIAEHQALVKAIANKDADAAEEAARIHVKSSRKIWLV
jgi:DNA-binding GntR family transcriptional regulator